MPLPASADPYLEPALACVNDFYARMFRDWPEAVTRTSGDCTLSYSGDTRLSGANHVWPHTPDAITPAVLQEASRFFEPYRAMWSVVCTDSYMPQAIDFLEQSGYALRWSSPLMVLDRRPEALPTNPHASVIHASTPDHLRDLGIVMGEAFATSNGVNRRVARVEHLGHPDVTHYLIYEHGQPAACATVAVCGKMAGIWNVGTRYRFRRQGYATTLMLALLADQRARGIHVSMLMASPSGQPLYERLGYRHIGVTSYLGPSFYNPSRFSVSLQE